MGYQKFLPVLNPIIMIPEKTLLISLKELKKSLKNLLKSATILKSFKSLKYLSTPACGIMIGRSTSKGIDAIKSIQLLFCFKKIFFGFEMINLADHSIIRTIHTQKSNFWMKTERSFGRDISIAREMRTMSINIIICKISHNA